MSQIFQSPDTRVAKMPQKLLIVCNLKLIFSLVSSDKHVCIIKSVLLALNGMMLVQTH